MSPEFETTLTWMFWVYLLLAAACGLSMMVLLLVPLCFAAVGSIIGSLIGAAFGSSGWGAVIGGVIGFVGFSIWWFIRQDRLDQAEMARQLGSHPSSY